MSSKLRKLKQQAYESGRKRDWSGAAEAYARILELDKSNPSLLNEYGDICLKAGDTAKALRQFLQAASRYKQTGLLNNAQAVYKKVLRHDDKNLNANWFLAEIRSAQGLLGEGEQYALTFLAAAEEISGEIKDIFVKRCLELFDLYPGSDRVLERVEGIYRIWDMKLEAARAGCLRAVLMHKAGSTEEAATAIAALESAVPELVNYVEYTHWREMTGDVVSPAGFKDHHAIDLDAGAEDQSAETVREVVAPGENEGSFADVAEDAASYANVATELMDEEPAAEVAPAMDAFQTFLDTDTELDRTDEGSPFAVSDEPVAPAADTTDDLLDRDEEGCISIDLGGETSFADLIDDATAAVEEAAAVKVADVGLGDLSSDTINLLDEILAEEGEDILRSSATEQVSTIASEIGRNMGEIDDEDPEAQYQRGLVYLEMGLYDQATLSFAGAARHAGHAMQAREMWGVALYREGRLEEALDVLEEGLATGDPTDRSVLGLRYNAGRILEELGRSADAQTHYRAVHGVDAGFADVAHRLRAPVV